MTPEEFRERMVGLFGENPESENYDIESAHCDADDLMCSVLRELGYGAGIDLFERASMWYA
jgi:hypothetical protein